MNLIQLLFHAFFFDKYFRTFITNLINIFKGIDDIIRKTGEQVNNEPCLHIVHSDELRIGDHLPCRTYECGVEVENNVHQEDDVHNAVHHQPRDVVLFGLEGHVVGHHDGGVEGENEDHPVPGGLKETVVQDDVGRGLRGLLLVLRQDVGPQLKNLCQKTLLENQENLTHHLVTKTTRREPKPQFSYQDNLEVT